MCDNWVAGDLERTRLRAAKISDVSDGGKRRVGNEECARTVPYATCTLRSMSAIPPLLLYVPCQRFDLVQVDVLVECKS